MRDLGVCRADVVVVEILVLFLFLFLFERWVAECNLFTLLLFSWATLVLIFSCCFLGGVAARIPAYGPYDCPDFLT